MRPVEAAAPAGLPFVDQREDILRREVVVVAPETITAPPPAAPVVAQDADGLHALILLSAGVCRRRQPARRPQPARAEHEAPPEPRAGRLETRVLCLAQHMRTTADDPDTAQDRAREATDRSGIEKRGHRAAAWQRPRAARGPMSPDPLRPGDRFAARSGLDLRRLATPYRWLRISPRRIQIEPGHADADREGGPAQQMETR